MADYTYNDMLRMQEEAAERVRAMKKRAALAMDEEEVQKQKSVPLPDDVRHYSMPVEFEKPNKENEPEIFNKTESHGLIGKITEDKDILIILAVLFVLLHEKTDYLTVLALTYILM